MTLTLRACNAFGRVLTPWVVPLVMPSWRAWARSPLVILALLSTVAFSAAQITPAQQRQLDQNTSGIEYNREELREQAVEAAAERISAAADRKVTKALAVGAHHLAETNQGMVTLMLALGCLFLPVAVGANWFYIKRLLKDSEEIAANKQTCTTLVEQLAAAEKRSADSLSSMQKDMRLIREKMMQPRGRATEG